MAGIKHALYSEITSSVSALHSAILTLKNSNSLVPGAYYKITDFQTIHIIPNTTLEPSTAALAVNGVTVGNPFGWDPNKPIKNEGVEELIILAITPSAFSPVAYSPSFPTDIIHYNFNDILCEDNLTPRRGKIVYRRDTILNIEAYYDWRKVIFRRWKLNAPVWAINTDYGRGAIVKGSDGSTYISKRAANRNNDPISAPWLGNTGWNGGANINSIWWEKIVVASKNNYLGTLPTQVTIASGTCPTIANDFVDYYTFNTSTIGDKGLIKNIKIGTHSTYNNIIFINSLVNWNQVPDNNESVFNNHFDDGCSDFTILGWGNNNNTFGLGCTNNILQGSVNNNDFDAAFNANLSIYSDYQSLGAMAQNKVAAGFSNNVFNSQFQYNTVMAGSYLSNNFFGFDFARNSIQGHFYTNSINKACSDNTFQFMNSNNLGDNFQHNVIYGGGNADNSFRNTTVGNDFKFNLTRSFINCVVGNTFQYNLIESGLFKGITILDGFQYNKFYGTVTAGTSFAINTNKNTFMGVFGGGTVSVPLLLTECVFNQPVVGLQFTSTGVLLARVVCNCAITNKTILSIQTNNTITASPDGNLWASNTQNTTGTITNTLIT